MSDNANMEAGIQVSTNYDGKPLSNIIRLIEEFLPHCEDVDKKKRATLTFQQAKVPYCYLLIKGSAYLYRQSDNIVLNTEVAPLILGLSDVAVENPDICIRATEGSEMVQIPRDLALRVIAQKSLWQDYSLLLIFVSSRIYAHFFRISQSNTYNTVRVLLLELDRESPDVKFNTTMVNYILDHSLLSRSGIMKILSALREGHFIESEKGHLVRINDLPMKY